MVRARSPRRSVVVAWIAAASVVAGTGVVLVAQAATPADASTSDRADVIPTDIVGHLIGECQQLIPEAERGTSIIYGFQVGPDGVGVSEVGTIGSINDDGSVTDFIPDPAMTATLNECFAAQGPIEVRNDWRPPTPAEQLLIYDWAHRWEGPCLAARGFEFTLPPYSSFVGDENNFPSYLLGAINPYGELEFSTIRATRDACAPIPPFLREAGVGP